MGPDSIPLEDKTLTVVYGSDNFVNVNFINFCCNNREMTQLWADSVLKMAYNPLACNASCYTFMKKSYTRLKLTADTKGNIPVKHVVKTFVNHKDDKKRLDKALDSCGLPSGKNDLIPGNKFSFDTFFSFRRHLAPRPEVEQIFHQLISGDHSHGHHSSSSPLNSEKSKSFDVSSSNSSKDHHHHHHHKEHQSSVSAVVSSIGSSILNKANSLQQNRHFSKSSHHQLMTVDQVVDFLNREQRDPRRNEILYPYADRAKGKEIIQTYEPNSDHRDKNLLSIDGFLRYLMSDECSIVDFEKIDLNHDMDQPLNHYFINSSHNTYLSGHQLTGKSSVEMYRQALLTGCRCIELDCWNGRNSDEEPIITHGYTVVTEIVLKDVLEAIADSAFKTSEFPVVLSFENHCSPKQQAKIANYCRKIFGDFLLTEALPSHPLKAGVPLPSPALLKRKIIIKNKKKHHVRRRAKQNRSQAASIPAPGTSPSSTAPTSGVTLPSQLSSDLTSTTTSSGVNVKISSSTPEKGSILLSSASSKPSLQTFGSDESGCSVGRSLERQDSVQLLLDTQESIDDASGENHVTTMTSSSRTDNLTTQSMSQPMAINKSPAVVSSVISTSCDIDDVESDSSGGELDDEVTVPGVGVAGGDMAMTTIMAKDSSAREGGGSGAVTSGDEASISLSLDTMTTTTVTSLEATAHIKETEAGAEMSALVLYIQPVRFHSFEYSESKSYHHSLQHPSSTLDNVSGFLRNLLCL